MGNFLIYLISYVTIHKQLVNGFVKMMLCNNESIYQFPKLINVKKNQNKGIPTISRRHESLGDF
jgi:hypothetical protein